MMWPSLAVNEANGVIDGWRLPSGDYDVPLLCTIPNGYGAESFDWIDGLIDNAMPIVDGMAYPRPGNGWGFSFRHDKMQEFK